MPYRPKKKKRPWQNERIPFKRAVSNQDFYNDRKWRKCSKLYLEKNPFCVKCKEEGIIKQADVTDHIKRLKDGGPAYDEDNLQSLCHKCHNQKSGKEAHGFKGGKGSNH